MGAETGISWTDSTWGPVRGCDDVSPGCLNCYAKGIAARFSGPGLAYEGLGKFVDFEAGGKRRRLAKWSGAGARLIPELLDLPTRWRRPRRIFVNSMSDLFHEALSNAEIAAVFGVMAGNPRHTFQVLTKRAKRMAAWFEWVASQGLPPDAVCEIEASNRVDVDQLAPGWPLKNVWLGVTAEDQKRADERIPLLLGTPAAVRWVSVEPQIGRVDLFGLPEPDDTGSPGPGWMRRAVKTRTDYGTGVEHDVELVPGLDWVVQGGESGTDARPFDLAWMRDLRDQCERAGVSYFAKQLGAKPYESVSPSTVGMGGVGLDLKDSAGAEPSEWPADLRVRQFPEVRS